MNSPIPSVLTEPYIVTALLALLDATVLALAARVNIYQEYFCMFLLAAVSNHVLTSLSVVADLFPFALSIATLVVLVFLCVALALFCLPKLR